MHVYIQLACIKLKMVNLNSSPICVYSVCLSVFLSLFLQVNPNYDSTFIFENDFPALQADAPDPGERHIWCFA